MAWNSMTFDPSSIASTSDAASSALLRASAPSSAVAARSGVWDKASTASSVAAVALGKASDASSAVAARSAVWDKASGASSKIAASSANWNKASDASSKASTALSKIATSSANWNKASNASSMASEALSRITARSTIWDKKTVILKCYDTASSVASGDDQMRFTIPNTLSGMNLVSCGAHVYTAPTSNSLHIDIYNITSAGDMLTSCMKIDQDETDTATATSQAVINTSLDNVVAAEEIRVDVTSVGSGAKGLEIRLTFEKP